MNHGEEGLLEWVGNRRGGIENVLETLFDQLWHCQRVVDRLGDPHWNGAQASASLWIGEQIVR